MEKSFYKWLDRQVDNENEWVKEDEGIRYFFCVDSIWDDFIEGAELTEEQFENDDYDELRPIWDEWAKTAKPFEYTQKDIQKRIKEDNADLRTQAMEMGFHGMSSDSMGRHTYYPSDDFPHYY